jgi:hypothetical protein
MVPPPITGVNSFTVFDNNATAISTMTGIFAKINSPNSVQGEGAASGLSGISLICGLAADELTLFDGYTGTVHEFHYRNQLSSGSAQNWGWDFWNLYRHIYVCNAAIEGLTLSTSLTPAVKQQLMGEAKFMRAFCYFYLVNLFGDVPLALTSDYTVNSFLSRAPVAQVYEQIITDLVDAQTLLSDEYVQADVVSAYPAGTEERVRPNKSTASALLARTYLYTGDYAKADTEASKVIDKTSLYELSTLDNAFLKGNLGNREAIWQLQPTQPGFNTQDGWVFVLNNAPSYQNPVYLSSFLTAAFESGDLRRTHWIRDTSFSGIPYSFAYKYKAATYGDPVTEYQGVFRLAEQYLIRAEARAQQGNISGAQEDLNVIRSRAGLGPTTAADQVSLLSAIAHEWQTEFFTEWGHRWLNLKRTGKIDEVMSAVTPTKANGSAWQSYQQLFPLPFTEIQYNYKLVQNPEY